MENEWKRWKTMKNNETRNTESMKQYKTSINIDKHQWLNIPKAMTRIEMSSRDWCEHYKRIQTAVYGCVWLFLFKFCLGARRFRNQSFLTLSDSDSVCVGAMVGSLPMFDILVLSLVLSVLINVVLISACVVKLVCPVSRPLPPPPKPHESGTSPEECERDSTESSVEDSVDQIFFLPKGSVFHTSPDCQHLRKKGYTVRLQKCSHCHMGRHMAKKGV